MICAAVLYVYRFRGMISVVYGGVNVFYKPLGLIFNELDGLSLRKISSFLGMSGLKTKFK